ncbi:peptide/nickel transport system substrate-binding protein [Roseomonas rosea]|uniref:Peptide/nickel transport system substrate-binding protein n=1 Tax=Muricoccus roseus TaxID=198092 RepID=A0A1M6IZI9_9PROT|nr:ABC transporter substrate-binding protein [Roseomonas rosea]SHJ39800.1 peptide/nickel transport system substrate-binding protein [Roseomonas rosea]
MERRHFLAHTASWLAAAGAGPAAAQSAGPRVTIAIGSPATSMDPHFYNATPNHTVAMHIFDRLTERMPDGTLVPGLATDWKLLSPTRWEFRLRPDVTWHDGKPFTAEDVAFTYTRARNVPGSPGGFGGFLRAITGVETPDPLTLHLVTAAPAPNLPRELAFVSIVSRHAGEGATTADYNSGKAAIGTGPYRFRRYVPGESSEFLRNESWWGEKPEFEAVTIRFVANDAARTAAILAGDVDVVDTPPAMDLPRLRREQRVSLHAIAGLRVIYLFPAFKEGESPFITDAAGKPLAANPLRDRRVRQALSVAINRQALADRIMSGAAKPTGQWLPPGTYSHAPSVGVPTYDTAGARQLLAEAGFPEGFRLTLHTPNDRYPNDAQVAQAVAQMWSRVGVQTAVEALPFSSYVGRANRREFAMGLLGWGSPTVEAGYLMSNVMLTPNPATGDGVFNYGGHSNPELDTLIRQALTELDEAARERLLIQAVEKASAEVPIIPLFILENTWATRKGLVYDARADERTLATNLRKG